MKPFRSLVFWNRCDQCGNAFETPSNPGSYDFKLLLSEKKKVPGVVLCDSDPAFMEVYKLIEELLESRAMASKKARVFNQIFGGICDIAPDGSLFSMSGEHICTNCGSSQMHFGPTSPPKYVLVTPVPVTHVRWDNLSRKEKVEWVVDLIAAVRDD